MVRLRNGVMVVMLATGLARVHLATGHQLPTFRSGTATRAMTFPRQHTGRATR